MKTPKPVARRSYDLATAETDYPDWRGAPRSTLLLCTQQRSGSTLLGEAIYFAGTLGCPLEYFHAGFRPGFERRWAVTDVHAYTAAVYRHRTDPSGILSVKLFWSDVAELARELEPDVFARLPSAIARRTDDDTYRGIFATVAALFPRPTFIHLTRRDEIRQAVSWSVAGQTSQWRRFGGSGHAGGRHSAYDFDEIVQRLADIQNDNLHWRNFFRSNALPHHDICYEDLAADYDGTLRRLFDAVGHPVVSVPAPRLKQQRDGRSEEFLRRFLGEFARRTKGS